MHRYTLKKKKNCVIFIFIAGRFTNFLNQLSNLSTFPMKISEILEMLNQEKFYVNQ